MKNQILISKQIAYIAKTGGGSISGINEINLLDTGAIALFTEDNLLITTSNMAQVLSDKKKFYIAVGNQTDTYSKSIISSLIPRRGTDYSKKAYVAPVKQIKYVGYDGTTAGTALNYPTLVVGETAFLKITDTTLGLRTFATDQKRYEVKLTSADTAATITEKMVNAINNDVDSIVVAAGQSTYTGIKLTAKEYGATFDVSFSGILENATMVEANGAITGVAVAPTFGEGTADQIIALEDLANTERGKTNRHTQESKWFNTTSLVIAGATYDLYTFNWNGTKQDSLSIQNSYNQTVQVALPLGGTTPKTAFETIMVEIFGGISSTSDTETGS